MAKRQTVAQDGGATVGYEAQICQIVDALCGSMHCAEHKQVVFGLTFPNYIWGVKLLVEMLEPSCAGVRHPAPAGAAPVLANDSMSSSAGRATR